MTVGEEKRMFVLALANEELFSPNRIKTMKALQTIGQRMTVQQIKQFPENVRLFAPERENDCGLICCPACEHSLLYLGADLEYWEQARITERLAAEFARLVIIGVPKSNEDRYTSDQEREAAGLVEYWTATERTADAA